MFFYNFVLNLTNQETDRRLYFTVAAIIINPLNAELNPIRHLLALVGARHIVHVSRIRVNLVAFLRQNTLGNF